MESRGNNLSDLTQLSREELEDEVHRLKAQNVQLRNSLQKKLLNGKKISKSDKKLKKEKEFDFSKHPKRHILLKFAYLGWSYQGFVLQDETSNTIEGALFDALSMTKLIESRETSNYHRCGRTDKGVSAFSQVISITVRSQIPNENSGENIYPHINNKELNYSQILNRVLPPDIRVLGWSPVPEGFSARFDCLSRTYKYFFPLANLNVKAMNEAAQFLVGEHDFRNFCKMDVGNGVIHFIRNILRVSFQEIDSKEEVLNHTCEEDNTNESQRDLMDSPWDRGYKMCVVTIEGVAFLWHQIRAIMTVLILVGEGKEEPNIVKKLLDVETVKRKPQYGFAREIGLNLYDTVYENITWQYDEENVAIVISQLQSLWSEHALKSSMLRHMLWDLSVELRKEFPERKVPSDQAAFCLDDPKTKVYRPLLERPTCESLEERVKHFVKRRRLDPITLELIKVPDGRSAPVDV